MVFNIPGWQLGLGLMGSGLMGAFGGSAADRYRSMARKHYKQLIAETPGYFGPSIMTLRESVGETKEGYKQARREVDKVGRAAREDILRLNKRNLAQIQQHLIQSGLTAVASQASRGVTDDTTQQLKRLEQGLSEVFSGIVMRGTDATAAAQARLAQGQQVKGQHQFQAKKSLADFAANAGGRAPNTGPNAGAFGSALGLLAPQISQWFKGTNAGPNITQLNQGYVNPMGKYLLGKAGTVNTGNYFMT